MGALARGNIGEAEGEGETPDGTDECENGRMGSEKEMTQLSGERGGQNR